MLRPPPITHALRFPATAGTMLLALAATIAWWGGVDCSPLFADAHVARGQLHRLVTSALLHGDPIHLVFNFYWIWTFGSFVERHLGSWKTLALFVFLAAGSNAAEFIFLTGGVGLSGVGYGLFGFLWFFWKRGQRHPHARDDRFAGAIDHKTEALFVSWFFACILLTITDLLPIGNIAHAIGALLGLTVAWAMTASQRTRKAHALPAAAIVILLLAATFARPHLNLSRRRGEQEASLGYQALSEKRDHAAARWMRDATAMNSAIASWWFNRGIAEARLQQHDAAMASYSNASRLEPANPKFRAARDALHDYLAAAR